jgi:hypothetical protein
VEVRGWLAGVDGNFGKKNKKNKKSTGTAGPTQKRLALRLDEHGRIAD